MSNAEHGVSPLLEEAQKPIEILSSDGSLTLRQFTPEDTEAIFELIDNSRDHLSQHGDDTARKYPTLDTVRESIEHPANPNRLRFGIRNHEDQLVGTINLTPNEENPDIGEIGYYLGSSHTGKGYTIVAVNALTDYAFTQLHYQTLFGKVAQANISSIKVLQRAGYKEKEIKEGEVYLYKENI